MHAHTQTSPPKRHGRSMVPPCGFPPAFTFTAHGGLNTPVLAGMLDSLVRVSRRGKENHFVRTGQRRDDTPRFHTPKRCYLPKRRLPQHYPALATAETQTNAPRGKGEAEPPDTGFLRFPFSNFRHSLTLFSKFFASFPHGTCSLSVSHPCLALDGIYHPL